MKQLLKLGILLLVSCSLAHQPDQDAPNTLAATTLRIRSKYGVHDVTIKNSKVLLTTRKNTTIGDDAFIHIELFQEDPSFSTQNLSIIMCGQEAVCARNGAKTVAIISTSLIFEHVTILRYVPTSKGRIVDCLHLEEDAQWIGGPQLRYQRWPIQPMYYEEEPYIPTHPVNMAIAERYWLSSKGFYIKISNSAPLFIDQNNYKDKHLCFVAQNKKPYNGTSALSMSYEIAWHNNSKTAHLAAVERNFGVPTGKPDERMIQYPIWSTWARYKANITESIINKFADEINANKFPNSQLEIDDNWETCYGSAVFDPVKFPNVTRLTQQLKSKGFRVTLWIHPFINEGCEPAYSTALKNGYFVKNQNGQVHTTWWQGEKGAGVIDFTKAAAVYWWVQRLKALERLGIDSFKFDAGESSWLPQVPILNGTVDLEPGTYTKAYVNALATNFNSMIEARVGWGTQRLPLFVRMIDKDTRWSWNNGLPTLITTLLQMNMAGYIWVLPDMIGGNGYLNGALNGTVLPSKELFIRWLQANVFMPSLQYSFTPWDFDKETVEICRKYTDLHAKITPTILQQMNLSMKTGEPVNPPIWWLDPTNQMAHKINDEFLLGNYLIAPVIEEGATTRNIYLPQGLWKDMNRNVSYSGPTFISDYPAPLSILPYFMKVK